MLGRILGRYVLAKTTETDENGPGSRVSMAASSEKSQTGLRSIHPSYRVDDIKKAARRCRSRRRVLAIRWSTGVGKYVSSPHEGNR